MPTCTCPCTCPASLDQQGLPNHAVPYPGAGHEWDSVPMGVDGTGGEVFWDVAAVPHLLVAGPPGAGKSLLMRLAALHVLAHSQRWDLAGIDRKGGIELSWLRRYEDVTVDTTGKEIRLCLEALNDMLDGRYARQEAGEEIDKGCLLIVDEADGLSEVDLHLLTRLATLGRAVRMHVLVGAQRPERLPQALLANLTGRIAHKRVGTDTANLLFRHTRATALAEIPGRGYHMLGRDEGPFQAYYAPVDWEQGA